MKEVLKYINSFWAISKGIRLKLLVCTTLGIAKVFVSLALVYFSKQLIDVATSVEEGSIYFYGLLLVLCFLSEIVFALLSSYLLSKSEIKLKNALRYNIFSYQLNAVYDGRNNMHSGNVMTRVEEDVRVVCDAVANSINNTLVTSVHLIGSFIFLCFLNPSFAIIITAIMPICLIGAKCYAWKMKKLTGSIRESDSTIHSLIQESLQNSMLIKALCRTQYMKDHLKQEQDVLYKKVIKRSRFSVYSRFIMALGFTSGYVVTFIWGASQIHNGIITFGVMTAFMQLVGQVQRPVVELARILPSFINAAASIDRLNELKAIPKEEDNNNQKISGDLGIKIENLYFSYPDDKRLIFNNFSCNFTPGSRTAILGETGTGKTTLVKLLLSLIKPNSGKISIYNTNGEEYFISPSMRNNFIYVPQGNSLMSGTIKDNLLLGNPNASDELIKVALHTAVADFVFSLPDGLETKCGELGKGLSDGQAQRIAIARALLSDGSIILFDEFSSSLDMDTERVLIERLSSSYLNKTMIFITHRQEVVKVCSNVINISLL